MGGEDWRKKEGSEGRNRSFSPSGGSGTCLTLGHRAGILCLGASGVQNRCCAETRQESGFLLRLYLKTLQA